MALNKEIERVVFGCLGLVLILRMAFRLWRWFSGTGAGETIWKAMVGDEPYCRLSFRTVQMGGRHLVADDAEWHAAGASGVSGCQ